MYVWMCTNWQVLYTLRWRTDARQFQAGKIHAAASGRAVDIKEQITQYGHDVIALRQERVTADHADVDGHLLFGSQVDNVHPDSDVDVVEDVVVNAGIGSNLTIWQYRCKCTEAANFYSIFV